MTFQNDLCQTEEWRNERTVAQMPEDRSNAARDVGGPLSISH